MTALELQRSRGYGIGIFRIGSDGQKLNKKLAANSLINFLVTAIV